MSAIQKYRKLAEDQAKELEKLRKVQAEAIILVTCLESYFGSETKIQSVEREVQVHSSCERLRTKLEEARK